MYQILVGINSSSEKSAETLAHAPIWTFNNTGYSHIKVHGHMLIVKVDVCFILFVGDILTRFYSTHTRTHTWIVVVTKKKAKKKAAWQQVEKKDLVFFRMSIKCQRDFRAMSAFIHRRSLTYQYTLLVRPNQTYFLTYPTKNLLCI